MSTEKAERARLLASAAHHGQTDKAGEPYIGHPARVAALVARSAPDRQREDAIVVAWLHDVVEDTDITLDDIAARFNDRVVQAVAAITHLPREPREHYYQRVRANTLARMVKFADITDNLDPRRLGRLEQEVRDRLMVKYAQAVVALT